MPQHDYQDLKHHLQKPTDTVITERDLIEGLQGPHVYSTLRDHYGTPIEWLKESSDSLIFNGIPYQGCCLDNIELTRTLLDDGQHRTQDAWLEPREDKYTLPDSELLFQLFRRLVQLHQDPAYLAIVKRARQQFQDIFDEHVIITATAIDYEPNTTRALVRSRSPLSKEKQNHIEIPILEQYHWILDLEQPAHHYLNEPSIPLKFHAALQAFFGNDWQHAPTVFKYFSPPINRNEPLTKYIQLWLPDDEGRRAHPSRIFSMGPGTADSFDIYANEYIDNCGWPALGVRSALEK